MLILLSEVCLQFVILYLVLNFEGSEFLTWACISICHVFSMLWIVDCLRDSRIILLVLPYANANETETEELLNLNLHSFLTIIIKRHTTHLHSLTHAFLPDVRIGIRIQRRVNDEFELLIKNYLEHKPKLPLPPSPGLSSDFALLHWIEGNIIVLGTIELIVVGTVHACS